jgi:hypothetical protein
VIYIVRDPRDVAVSFYHHNLKARNIPDGYPMEEFVRRFIAAEFDAKWGSWSEHVVSWLSLRQNDPAFILLLYEDLKENPVQGLARVADFLGKCSFPGIDTSLEKLQRVVELSSPERMRQLEKEQSRSWILTKHTRQDKPFVRTAASGGWKSGLSEGSIHAIETAWGETMQSLGYQLTSASRAVSR